MLRESVRVRVRVRNRRRGSVRVRTPSRGGGGGLAPGGEVLSIAGLSPGEGVLSPGIIIGIGGVSVGLSIRPSHAPAGPHQLSCHRNALGKYSPIDTLIVAVVGRTVASVRADLSVKVNVSPFTQRLYCRTSHSMHSGMDHTVLPANFTIPGSVL